MKRCAFSTSGISLFCIVSLIMLGACVGQNAKQGAEASPEAAKQFLKLKGYEFDPKGFFTAVALNDLNAVNAFIAAKFDLNVKDSVTGRTALIMAAASGDLISAVRPVTESFTLRSNF